MNEYIRLWTNAYFCQQVDTIHNKADIEIKNKTFDKIIEAFDRIKNKTCYK